MKNFCKFQLVGVSLTALLVSGAAYAEEPAASSGVEDIVVTAQKRSENLQKTPAAVTAIAGTSLVQTGTTDLRAVQNLVPAARFQQQGSNTQVILRGVGSNLDFGNIEPTVAFNMNGVYTPREGSSQPLFDLERIEVLPGPQGTLYGRNALGGTVNVSFKRPTRELESSGVIEAGNYGLVHGTVVQNIPLTDTLAVRAAADYTNHKGYMESGAYAKDDIAGRLGLLYTPNDDLTVYLWGTGVSKSGSPSNLVNKGTDPVTGAYSENAYLRDRPWDDQRIGIWAPTAGTWGQPQKEDQVYHLWNFGGQIDIGLGDGITLTYIPGYFSLDSNSKYWLGVLPSAKKDNYRLATQELRLSGETDRLNWLVGLYGYTQKTVGDYVLGDLSGYAGVGPFHFGAISSRVLHHRVKGVALFGQATYKVTDAVRLTVGGRGSFDKRTANGISLADQVSPYTYSESFKRFDYKVGGEVDLSSTVMGYLTYQTGYQPGTFNEFVDAPGNTNRIKSPKLNSITGGLKTRLLDNRLQVNIEGFYYSYKDLLIQAYDSSQSLNKVYNGKDVNYGAQVDTVFRPTENDRLSVSVAYLHARIKTITGLPGRVDRSPPYAANLTFNAAYYHDFHMANGFVRPAVDVRYEGAFYADYLHNLGVRQKAVMRENASLTYFADSEKWSAGLWIKNISNKAVLAATAFAGVPGPATAYLEEPRTYGGRVTFKF